MMDWSVLRDLGQVSLIITGWALFVGAAIGGLTVSICVIFWIGDCVRKALGDRK